MLRKIHVRTVRLLRYGCPLEYRLNGNFDTMMAMCETAFDNGITHFDLANNYGPVPGAAEENFGRILKKSLGAYRDELVISTKAGYDMFQ